MAPYLHLDAELSQTPKNIFVPLDIPNNFAKGGKTQIGIHAKIWSNKNGTQPSAKGDRTKTYDTKS